MLGGALDAGKVADNPMAPTIAEHQLSLRRDANRASGIEHKITAGETRYLWHAKELFAYSTTLVPLAAADRDLYIRYVRNTVGGHPEILEDLKKLDGIPKWLRYLDPGFGTAVRLEVIGEQDHAGRTVRFACAGEGDDEKCRGGCRCRGGCGVDLGIARSRHGAHPHRGERGS